MVDSPDYIAFRVPDGDGLLTVVAALEPGERGSFPLGQVVQRVGTERRVSESPWRVRSVRNQRRGGLDHDGCH